MTTPTTIEDIIKNAKVEWGILIGAKSNQFDQNKALEQILKKAITNYKEHRYNAVTTPKTVEEIAVAIKERYAECNGSYTPAELCEEVVEALTAYGNARHEEGVKAEATRRDGIGRAIEQSIIDQHVTMAVKAERDRIELEVIRTFPFYPEAQECVLDIINNK